MNIKRNNIFYYVVGNAIPRFISYVFLPILSFFLSKNDLGIYDLFIATISLLTPIISFQIADACYRWSFEEINTDDIIITVLVFSILSHIIPLLLTLFIIYFFSINLNTLFVYSIFLTSFTSVLQGMARTMNQIKVYAASFLLNSFTIIIFTAFFFYFGTINISSVLKAYIFSNLVSVLFLLLALKLDKRIISGKYDGKMLVKLIDYSLPLIPNAVSWWLVSMANRYLITFSLGVEANANFAVASRIPSFILFLNSIFLLVLQDLVFKKNNLNEAEANYTKLFTAFFNIQLSIAILIIAFNKYLVRLMFADMYLETHKLIPYILIGVLLTNFSSFWGTFYLLEKKTKTILMTTIYGGGANIFFSYLLVDYLGILAPAIGTIIGFGIIWIIRIQYINKYKIISFEYTKIIPIICLFVFILMLTYLENSIFEIGTRVLSVGIFSFYNYPFLKKLFVK